MEYTHQSIQHVTDVATEVGLHFDFEKAVVANSFDAHRLLHLAKKHQFQNQCKELLLAAYFTEGKNTADHEVLTNIGIQIGLDANEISKVLESNQFTDEVIKDLNHAQEIGVRGVPFFVLGNKYAISGAQSSETFLAALTQTWNETVNVK
jgi:predicted DsbA family dithiol-disulfide isomerase